MQHVSLFLFLFLFLLAMVPLMGRSMAVRRFLSNTRAITAVAMLLLVAAAGVAHADPCPNDYASGSYLCYFQAETWWDDCNGYGVYCWAVQCAWLDGTCYWVHDCDAAGISDIMLGGRACGFAYYWWL